MQDAENLEVGENFTASGTSDARDSSQQWQFTAIWQRGRAGPQALQEVRAGEAPRLWRLREGVPRPGIKHQPECGH